MNNKTQISLKSEHKDKGTISFSNQHHKLVANNIYTFEIK